MSAYCCIKLDLFIDSVWVSVSQGHDPLSYSIPNRPSAPSFKPSISHSMYPSTNLIPSIHQFIYIIFGAFETFPKASCPSVRPPAHPHGMTWLPLNGFSWNSILEYYSKSVEKNKVWLKSDNSNECLYLSEFVLEWEMFQAETVVKIKTHFIFNIFSPQSYVPLIR